MVTGFPFCGRKLSKLSSTSLDGPRPPQGPRLFRELSSDAGSAVDELVDEATCARSPPTRARAPEPRQRGPVRWGLHARGGRGRLPREGFGVVTNGGDLSTENGGKSGTLGTTTRRALESSRCGRRRGHRWDRRYAEFGISIQSLSLPSRPLPRRLETILAALTGAVCRILYPNFQEFVF